MISVLCGGVGAARLLSGMVEVVDQSDITAVVNTGDDLERHGLYVCPDLDTVTYTLAGENAETGWGLIGESFNVLRALERFGEETWFALGDKDLATHLFRTRRLSDGAGLDEVEAEIAAAYGLRLGLLPMSNDPVRTMVKLLSGPEVSFQEYFVKLSHDIAVEAVRFEGSEGALPAPGVLDALSGAESVVVAPSNPVVSIGPILSLPGVTEALQRRRSSVVAISPIVAGRALKGPADRLLLELGEESSVVGVAHLLAPVAGTLVIDHLDEDLAPRVAEAGMEPVVTDTVMASKKLAAVLSEHALEAVRERSGPR